MTAWVLGPKSPLYLWIIGVMIDFLIMGGIFFLLLQLIPARGRKTLIMICTFLAGLIYSLEYFIPGDKAGRNFMTNVTDQVNQGTTLIYAFALGLGIYSLIRFHGRNLMRKRSGWQFNLSFFVAFFTLLTLGFWQDMSHSKIVSHVYVMLRDSTVVAFSASMFSMIGFYIISAAYRAFRVRSGEATLMLVAAFIVMLGQVAVGAFITNWLPTTGPWSFFRFENLGYWILTVPNMAAQRGIAFGIEVGAFAMALRIWLSLERGSFFEQEL